MKILDADYAKEKLYRHNSFMKKPDPFEKFSNQSLKEDYKVVATLNKYYSRTVIPDNWLLKAFVRIWQGFAWVLIGPNRLIGDW